MGNTTRAVVEEANRIFEHLDYYNVVQPEVAFEAEFENTDVETNATVEAVEIVNSGAGVRLITVNEEIHFYENGYWVIEIGDIDIPLTDFAEATAEGHRVGSGRHKTYRGDLFSLEVQTDV